MTSRTSKLGAHLRIKHGFAFDGEQFSNSGSHVVVTPGHFYEQGGFRSRGDKEKYYLGEFSEEYVLSRGDIVIVMTEQAPGLIGASAIIPEDGKYLHNQRIGLVENLDPENIDSGFVYHLFNSSALRKQLHETASGTKVRHTSPERIYAAKFNLYTLLEQRRITGFLNQWDDAITLTERLIAAKQQLRRGLMQQLLTGKRRFPGFSEPWGEVRLGDICHRVVRKNDEGNTNVLTISGQNGLVSQTEFFNRQVASVDLSGYFLLRRGEFAFNKSTSTGYPFGAIKRLDRYATGLVSTLYICFGLDEEQHNSDFMAHFFEAGRCNQGIYKIAHEGARSHGLLNVTPTDFFDIRFRIPKKPEQERIAQVLSQVDKEFTLLQTQLAALKTQKRGLMQQLLTGKVRVPLPDVKRDATRADTEQLSDATAGQAVA